MLSFTNRNIALDGYAGITVLKNIIVGCHSKSGIVSRYLAQKGIPFCM